MAEGTKYDQDKPRVDLLDPLALEGLAKVLTFGAKKYAAHNWRGGISYSRLIGALLRHTFAIIRGEDTDPESGYPHVDHLGCCWMFLSNMMKTRPDLDDRWKPQYQTSLPQDLKLQEVSQSGSTSSESLKTNASVESASRMLPFSLRGDSGTYIITRT